MSAPSADSVSHLIGLIYDTAIDPDRWPVALEAMRVALRCSNSALSLQANATGQVLLDVTTNIPQSYAERIADYGADVLEQWGGLPKLLSLPADQPFVLSVVNPDAVRFERTTNRYSLEWAKPQGLTDVIAVLLARDEQAFGAVAFGRHESAGPFGEDEVHLARLLIPHLQRAATINRLLDLSALARSSFEAALGALATPVLLVTSGLALVHANEAARRMLEDGLPLRLRSGIVSAASPGATQALAVAVSQAAHDESVLDRKGFGIPFAKTDRTVGALHVLPLRRGRLLFAREAVAGVFVAQSNRPFPAPTGVVAELFGLTPAEARVFALLVGGSSLAEASRRLGIEPSTVKTHTQRIYAKVGVRRQVDLVMLALSLVPPTAPE